jgi:hypothetical protein
VIAAGAVLSTQGYAPSPLSIVLGGWIFGDVQVVVPTVDYAQERYYGGLIGRDTLSTFNLIFDYKDGELWFKPIDFGKT